jgi:hypothetical protein
MNRQQRAKYNEKTMQTTKNARAAGEMGAALDG